MSKSALQLDDCLGSLVAFWHVATIILIGPIVSMMMVYIIFFTPLNSIWRVAAILYAYWIWHDWDTPRLGGRKFSNCVMRQMSMFDYYVKYFKLRIVKTAELDADQSYLMGSHPHGILAFGLSGAFGTDAANVKRIFPDHETRVVTLVQNFTMPVSREILLSYGAVSCSRQSLKHLFSLKQSTIATLVVGGAEEALDSEPGKINLIIKRRRGFVKTALSCGTPLVPSFTFGECDVYSQIEASRHKRPWLHSIQIWIKKLTGFAPVLFFGKLGLLPQPASLTIVVGKPIPLPIQHDIHFDTLPSSEQDRLVKLYHAAYMAELVSLYETHNGTYGDKKCCLVLT